MPETAKPPDDLVRHEQGLGPIDELGMRGFSPPKFDQLRLVILGAPKTGKSTFAQSDAASSIYACERGCGFTDSQAIIVPKPASDSPLTMPMFHKVHGWLLAHPNFSDPKHPRRIVFDPFDTFVELVDAELTVAENKRRRGLNPPRPEIATITEYGEAGAGYHKLLTKLLTYLFELEQCGYGWTLIIHEDVKVAVTRTRSGEEFVSETKKPAVYPSFWSALKKRPDYTARLVKSFRQRTKQIKTGAGVATVAAGGSEPYVRLLWHAAEPGQEEQLCGYRLRLPDLDLPERGGMPLLAAKYNEAVAAYAASIRSPVSQ